jgi:hypothetical protein
MLHRSIANIRILPHCRLPSHSTDLTCSSWSASTIATMLSTIGTALGTTQGSWRPLALSSVSMPSRVTVFCFTPMVEVGLKATRMTMSSPLEIPPWTPPDRLDLVLTYSTSWEGYDGVHQPHDGFIGLMAGSLWIMLRGPYLSIL